MLAEQGDGLDVRFAIQTATVRPDVNGAAGMNPWVTTLGTVVTQDGDQAPEDITISGQTGGEFWYRTGIAYKKGGTSFAIGGAQVAIQLAPPTDGHQLIGSPVVINQMVVEDRYTEHVLTGWMSFTDLVEVAVAYDIYDTTNFRTKIVLQSVLTNPTNDVPVEDDILSATAGDLSDMSSSSTFTNASNNKAMLFRIVLKADNNSAASEGTGRVWAAVSCKWQ